MHPLVARSVIVLLASLSLHIGFIGEARSEVVCQIADPGGKTLNVREWPNGKIINRLKNGRIVRVEDSALDTEGRQWDFVGGSYKGQWRRWGWVYHPHLRCVDPITFGHETIPVKELQSVGLFPQSALPTHSDPSRLVSCGVVPNGWGIDVGAELFRRYEADGFYKDAICLAFGSDEVHFDPESGNMLPLYVVAGDIFEMVRPLRLPRCFRTVKILPNEVQYVVKWRPTGCKIRFHPTTGVRIEDASVVELGAGGEAGPGTDESSGTSSISEERLRRIVYGR